VYLLNPIFHVSSTHSPVLMVSVWAFIDSLINHCTAFYLLPLYKVHLVIITSLLLLNLLQTLRMPFLTQHQMCSLIWCCRTSQEISYTHMPDDDDDCDLWFKLQTTVLPCQRYTDNANKAIHVPHRLRYSNTTVKHSNWAVTFLTAVRNYLIVRSSKHL